MSDAARRLTDFDAKTRAVADAIGCVNDEQCTARRGPKHCWQCLQAATRAIKVATAYDDKARSNPN